MARGTLDANAAFAAMFASSVELGCFFESRGSVGVNSSSQSIPGGFPVNYPYTWLRLRRSADVFTGFASLDGQTWVQLGSATITLPSLLYFGLAVTSPSRPNHNCGSTTTAKHSESREWQHCEADCEPLSFEPPHRDSYFRDHVSSKPLPGIRDNLEFIEI
jgi:hypothetical protein